MSHLRPRTEGAEGRVGVGGRGGSGLQLPAPPVFIPQASGLYSTSASLGSRGAPRRFLWTSDLACWVGISSPPLPSSGPGLLRCPGSLLTRMAFQAADSRWKNPAEVSVAFLAHRSHGTGVSSYWYLPTNSPPLNILQAYSLSSVVSPLTW